MGWHRPDRPAVYALIAAGLLSGALAWVKLTVERVTGWQ
jgi:hypothetical protein